MAQGRFTTGQAPESSITSGLPETDPSLALEKDKASDCAVVLRAVVSKPS